MRERKDMRNKRKQKWSTFLNEINCQTYINYKENNDTERQKITLTPSESYVSPSKGRTQIKEHPPEAIMHRTPIKSNTSPIFAPSVTPLDNSSPSSALNKPHLTTSKPHPSEPPKGEVISGGAINTGNFVRLLLPFQ
jgi:hypothetical protein